MRAKMISLAVKIKRSRLLSRSWTSSRLRFCSPLFSISMAKKIRSSTITQTEACSLWSRAGETYSRTAEETFMKLVFLFNPRIKLKSITNSDFYSDR